MCVCVYSWLNCKPSKTLNKVVCKLSPCTEIINVLNKHFHVELHANIAFVVIINDL